MPYPVTGPGESTMNTEPFIKLIPNRFILLNLDTITDQLHM